MDNLYERAYYHSKANGHETFFFEKEEISIAGKTLDELQKQNKIKDRPLGAVTSAQKTFELVRIRKINDTIIVTKLNENYEFITSDNPVTCRNTPGQHVMPFDPTNTLSLPINNKYMVQLMHCDDKDIDNTMIGRFPSELMSGINSSMNNQYQMAQSDRFLLGTETALKKFQQNPSAVSINLFLVMFTFRWRAATALADILLPLLWHPKYLRIHLLIHFNFVIINRYIITVICYARRGGNEAIPSPNQKFANL